MVLGLSVGVGRRALTLKAVCIDYTALRLYLEGINPARNMLAIGTSVHMAALQRLSKATVFSL